MSTAYSGHLINNGTFVGTIGSFTMDGEREVTYWIDPSGWGRIEGTRAPASQSTTSARRRWLPVSASRI